VDFGLPIGSEPGWRRPAVVVSSDLFNRSGIATVLVAAVTSAMSRGAAPGNVTLPSGAAGLPRPSVVNVSSVAAIDRSRLVERSGVVTADVMTDVDDGLRLVLSL
jgi:mRNA interferase MazF